MFAKAKLLSRPSRRHGLQPPLRMKREFSSSTTTTTTTTAVGGEKIWNVYLSGEIHSDWRQEIADGVAQQQQHLGNMIRLTSPNTCHVDSDDCGAYILGMVDDRKVWDGLGARMNQIRNQTLLQQADIVVVKFGDKYRQWNVAFDAGYAVALHKPLIVLHDPAHNLSHMLKEITAAAAVVCATPVQVVQTLDYVMTGRLPAQPKDGVNYIPIADRLGKGNPNP